MIFHSIIRFLSQNLDCKNLAASQAKLQAMYKSLPNTRSLQTHYELASYIVTRMPATYAVLKRCFMELPPHFSPKTILDLGTGPGTALWACLDSFSEISTLHGYDYHPELLALAQRVVDEFHIPNITLENGRLEHFPISSPSYDLVILSYVLNECSIETAWTVSEKAFDLTQGALLITLPGTPRDFHLLLNLRRKFIEKGVALWAPCPHLGPCPLEHGDWCHFSERLQRTPLHKTLKKGSLGYEDEKFCYLLLGHLPKEAYKRIIKPPQHKKGHVLLSVCTETGAEQQHTVSQKDPTYKLIKKKNWGDQIM